MSDKERLASEFVTLLGSLVPEIGDEYRASEDSVEASMLVTFATTNGKQWVYQTGDTSYEGACYGHPHWASVELHRDSDLVALAKQAVELLEESLADAQAEEADDLLDRAFPNEGTAEMLTYPDADPLPGEREGKMSIRVGVHGGQSLQLVLWNPAEPTLMSEIIVPLTSHQRIFLARRLLEGLGVWR